LDSQIGWHPSGPITTDTERTGRQSDGEVLEGVAEAAADVGMRVVRVRALSAEQQPVPAAPLHRQVADHALPAVGRPEDHGVVLEHDAAQALAGGVLALLGVRPPRVEQGEAGDVVAGVRPVTAHPPVPAVLHHQLGDAPPGLAVGHAAAGHHAELRQERAADRLAHELHALRREVVLHGRVVGLGGAGHRGGGCEGHDHGGEACHSWWVPDFGL